MESDDTELWEEVKRSIRPLKGKAIARSGTKHKTSIKKPLPVAREKTPESKPPSSPLPARQIRKLRRQDIPIEATLDLHGMTVEKAHGALTRFLGRARQKGMRCVEIVTGRGNPERGTGKLRRQLPLWLEQETGI